MLRKTLSLFRRIPQFFGQRVTATRCGHLTHLTGEVEAFGDHTVTKMPRDEHGSTQYCLDCIGKMAIKCAWCGETIFIGNPVTLYTPRGEFSVPEHAVIYQEDPLQLVGCLGMNCAETGADRAGFWVPGNDGKGKVERVMSALEVIMETGGTHGVIMADASDPNAEVTTFTLKEEG